MFLVNTVTTEARFEWLDNLRSILDLDLNADPNNSIALAPLDNFIRVRGFLAIKLLFILELTHATLNWLNRKVPIPGLLFLSDRIFKIHKVVSTGYHAPVEREGS